jgi:neutral ceramidase
MRTIRVTVLPLLLLASAASAATLRAGAAEGTLDSPIGLPPAGFTARSVLFGFERADARATPFARLFAPSTAVHTRPGVKAVALTGGGETLVLVKVDLIFSDAYLLRAVEDLASAASGEPLRGRLILSASHSHSSPGRFSQHTGLMAGADTYHEATFRRFAESMAAVVAGALAAREPARLGIAVDPTFDPLGEDRIFRDRRPENDHLAPDGGFLFEPDGVTVDLHAPGARGPAKDPALTLLRVDRADGTPLAVVLVYGIHGTALGDEVFALDAAHPEERHLWISGEAASAVEWKLEESFRRPVVVMHLQGAAGDVAPAGDDLGHRAFARLELAAERARAGAERLWRRTPTDRRVAIRIATRQVEQAFGAVRVERGGAVDWRYPAEPGPPFDGNLLSFEDWHYPLSAALCGGRRFDLGAGGIVELAPEERARVDPDPASPGFGRGLVYGSCVSIEDNLFGLFSSLLDPTFDPLRDRPIPESLSTLVTAVALEGVPVRRGAGEARRSRVLLAAAPGEPTTYWSERLRSRAREEAGFDEAVVVGYAQDHEGYLLLPEDWLSGGATEVKVNLWGPLQGEYLLERLLETSALVASPGPVSADPGPLDPPPGAWSFDPVAPAATPLAGTALEGPLEEVERLETASFEWIGGDPAVDQPRVVLQRRSRRGDWRDVALPSGRPLDDRTHRIVLVYRPEPIRAGPAQIERHRYRAYFQVVEDLPSLEHAAGFRKGTYRFRVEGHAFDGTEVVAYQVCSSPFTVVPTDALELMDLEIGSRSLRGRVVLPPPTGYRLESLTARAGEPISVAGARVRMQHGGATRTDADGRFSLRRTRRGSDLLVEDRFGNRATLRLDEAARRPLQEVRRSAALSRASLRSASSRETRAP